MLDQISNSTIFITISQVYRITLLVYDGTGSVVESFPPHLENGEMLFIISNCKERLFEVCSQTKQTQIISSDINQLWAGIPLVAEGNLTQMIVVGPIYTSEISKNIAIEYAQFHYYSNRPKGEFLQAIRQTPIYPYAEFIRLLALIHAALGIEALDVSGLTITGFGEAEIAFSSELHYYQEGQEKERKTADEMYDFEGYLLDCIREGNLEKLKRHLRSANYEHINLLSNIDPIRRQKLFFTILVTLAIRGALNGGLNAEIAASLSDLYIQQVESMHNLPAILNLTRKMLYDLTLRVSELKRTHDYSNLVNECCNYIDEHIRENIKVADIAEQLGFNAHYVAMKFREEVGRTIREYIRGAKVSEAKSLLKYSNLSLTEISELLSFSSQSYFTTTFKNVTGITPRQYRERIVN